MSTISARGSSERERERERETLTALHQLLHTETHKDMMKGRNYFTNGEREREWETERVR